MTDDKPRKSRSRTRAIRERMAATGEPYTLAARRHDEERMARDAGKASGDTVRVQLSPAEEITDPDRAEALGLTVDARRMRQARGDTH